MGGGLGSKCRDEFGFRNQQTTACCVSQCFTVSETISASYEMDLKCCRAGELSSEDGAMAGESSKDLRLQNNGCKTEKVWMLVNADQVDQALGLMPGLSLPLDNVGEYLVQMMHR